MINEIDRCESKFYYCNQILFSLSSVYLFLKNLARYQSSSPFEIYVSILFVFNVFKLVITWSVLMKVTESGRVTSAIKLTIRIKVAVYDIIIVKLLFLIHLLMWLFRNSHFFWIWFIACFLWYEIKVLTLSVRAVLMFLTL